LDTKSDLWDEFAKDEDDDSAAGSEGETKKPVATDGSEWTGRFDRRSKPRDEAADSGDADAASSGD
jgi:hypothetical protein